MCPAPTSVHTSEIHVLDGALPTLTPPPPHPSPSVSLFQAAGAEGAAFPPEGGAKGPAAAQQQAAGPEGADLPTLRAGDHRESPTPPSPDPGPGRP